MNISNGIIGEKIIHFKIKSAPSASENRANPCAREPLPVRHDTDTICSPVLPSSQLFPVPLYNAEENQRAPHLSHGRLATYPHFKWLPLNGLTSVRHWKPGTVITVFTPNHQYLSDDYSSILLSNDEESLPNLLFSHSMKIQLCKKKNK